jgi:hypothetical protein
LSRNRTDRFEICEYLKIFKEVTINISPRQIWNPDEIIYCFDPSRIRVLGERRTAVHRATSGQDRGNITIFMAADLDGEIAQLIVGYSKPKRVGDS